MPTHLTALKTFINAYINNCRTEETKLIPKVFLGDLSLLEGYLTKLVELETKYANSDVPPTNDDLETLNMSIVIVMECIKKIDDRINPRWNITSWTSIVLNWIQVRAEIINVLILGTLAIMTDVTKWGFVIISVNPLETVTTYFKVYSYANLGQMQSSVNLYADKFNRLQNYMLSSLYTGTVMDEDTSKFEAYQDQEEILSNSENATKLVDEAGNDKGMTLSALVYTTTDRAAEAIPVANMVTAELVAGTARSVALEAKYIEYMSSNILRYANSNRSNVSQSVKIIEEVLKFRDDWLDKIRKWSIGMFRTVAEICNHPGS